MRWPAGASALVAPLPPDADGLVQVLVGSELGHHEGRQVGAGNVVGFLAGFRRKHLHVPLSRVVGADGGAQNYPIQVTGRQRLLYQRAASLVKLSCE